MGVHDFRRRAMQPIRRSWSRARIYADSISRHDHWRPIRPPKYNVPRQIKKLAEGRSDRSVKRVAERKGHAGSLKPARHAVLEDQLYLREAELFVSDPNPLPEAPADLVAKVLNGGNWRRGGIRHGRCQSVRTKAGERVVCGGGSIGCNKCEYPCAFHFLSRGCP